MVLILLALCTRPISAIRLIQKGPVRSLTTIARKLHLMIAAKIEEVSFGLTTILEDRARHN